MTCPRLFWDFSFEPGESEPHVERCRLRPGVIDLQLKEQIQMQLHANGGDVISETSQSQSVFEGDGEMRRNGNDPMSS